MIARGKHRRPGKAPHHPARVNALRTEVERLRDEIVGEAETVFRDWQSAIVRPAFRPSAMNLAHYLALRRRDLRKLQPHLAALGLSSLGRCEARVMANIDAIIATLSYLCPSPGGPYPHPSESDVFAGDEFLRRNTELLLGRAPVGRDVRIMVTLPPEAADDAPWVKNLLSSGTDAVRINCAHDDPDAWARMAANVRRAARRLRRPCRVLMDLAGPKLRTGAVLTPEDSDRLHDGDTFLLTRDLCTGPRSPAFQATCTCPEVLGRLRRGDRVLIDDGRLQCLVERIVPAGVLLKVSRTRPKGEKLRAEKSINFPDTPMHLTALTDKDRTDLPFVAKLADIVGYSFVQEPEDLAALDDALASHGRGGKLGLIAKIETARAVSNLPALIVHAAGARPFGVMIARGDLAVEIGFERLAEIQEEILWICEAAHTPVIWATQVLENLAKTGIPSRAELTDAAMAERAECVMLNKGPFIRETVAVLSRILSRMGGHQVKKTPQLRALQSWPLEASCAAPNRPFPSVAVGGRSRLSRREPNAGGSARRITKA